MSCVVTRQPHSLINIYSTPYLSVEDGYQIVRWCENCGAVVVDVYSDGRTYPGELMTMKFPLLAKREAARADRDEILGVRQ